MKKRGLLIVLALALTFIMVACSNDNKQGSNKDSDKVLTYWSNFNEGEPNQVILKNIIDDYQEANPDVKIEVEWMGRQVMSKVRNAMLSGNGPDLIDKAAPEILGSIGDDTESLNDLLDEKMLDDDSITLQETYLDKILDHFKREDKYFFIPFQIISSGFFYDNKLFEENNAQPAETWEEFLELTDLFEDNGISALAHDGNIGFYNAYYFYWLSARINGVGAFNNAASDETGEAWDDPGFMDVAKKVEELVNKNVFIKGYEGSQFPAGQTQWAQGEAAMILNGSWLPHETESYASEDFEYSVFPFPTVEGGKGNSTAEIELIGWAVPEGGNVELAKDFILFGMQEEYQQQVIDIANNISIREDLDAPENLEGLKDHILNAEEIHKLYDGVEADYPKWWNTIFLPTHDKLFFGDITAEEFIDSIKKQTIDFYKEN